MALRQRAELAEGARLGGGRGLQPGGELVVGRDDVGGLALGLGDGRGVRLDGIRRGGLQAVLLRGVEQRRTGELLTEGRQLGAAEHRDARGDAERLVGLVGDHRVQPLGVRGLVERRGEDGARPLAALRLRDDGRLRLGWRARCPRAGRRRGRPRRSATVSASPVSTSARAAAVGLGGAGGRGVLGREQPGGHGGRALGVERRGRRLLGRGRVQADEGVLGAAAGEHERAEQGGRRHEAAQGLGWSGGGHGARGHRVTSSGSWGSCGSVVSAAAEHRRHASQRRRRGAATEFPGACRNAPV